MHCEVVTAIVETVFLQKTREERNSLFDVLECICLLEGLEVRVVSQEMNSVGQDVVWQDGKHSV